MPQQTYHSLIGGESQGEGDDSDEWRGSNLEDEYIPTLSICFRWPFFSPFSNVRLDSPRRDVCLQRVGRIHLWE